MICNISSRTLAEITTKQHCHIIRDIRRLAKRLNMADHVQQGRYIDVRGRPRTYVSVTHDLAIALARSYKMAYSELILEQYVDN